MPIVDVEGQQFEFPDGTPDAIIGDAIRQHFATEQPQAAPALPDQAATQPAPAPEQPKMSEASQSILDAPGGAALSEFASAVNRGAINLIDMVGPDVINNALAVIGSDKRVPTLGEQDIVKQATIGEFMEDGLAKRAVRTGGEFVAPVGATGATLRAAAAQASKLAAPTVTQRVAQAAASPAIPELAAGAAAGAGSEVGSDVGGDIGEAVSGDEGRETGEYIGRLAGSILAPVSATIAKETGKTLISKSAKKLLTESAPTIDGLKKAARSVYDDLDNSGVNISSSGIGKLAGQLRSTARAKGFNSKIHPKVAAALKEFDDAAATGAPIKLSEIDILRRITGAAAKSIDPDEARLGSIVVNRVDDFLDHAGKDVLSKTNKDIGAKYRDARQLWRRVKKTEQLDEAFSRAQLQATGFENGIRTQFRSILNSKKKSKGFTKDELSAMREVVQGTSLQNTAKLLGRFGFGEGQASNMLMGYAGIAGGAAVGGPVGAVVVPSIGQLSRKLAQRLTREGAKNAQLIIRAGSNGREVVKAYMKITPPKQRSAQELTELLLRPDISLKGLKKTIAAMPQKDRQMVDDSIFLVSALKASQEEEE